MAADASKLIIETLPTPIEIVVKGSFLEFADSQTIFADNLRIQIPKDIPVEIHHGFIEETTEQFVSTVAMRNNPSSEDDDPPHSADCPRAVLSSAECLCPAQNAARYRDDDDNLAEARGILRQTTSNA